MAVAQRIADRVLDALRAVARVVDAGVAAAEIAGERAVGIDMLVPGKRAQRGVQRIRRIGLQMRDLEEYPARHARLEAGAIGDLERAREAHAERTLAHVRCAERRQLRREQVGEAARRTGEAAHHGRGGHGRTRGAWAAR